MPNIFRVAYKKGKKLLLKIDTQDGSDTPVQWMNTTEAVYNFVKENFEDGDEIGIEYTKKGKLYHVDRVNKEGKNNEKAEATDSSNEQKIDITPNEGYHCKDCGKELKDSKYEKCYTCNQKNPSTSTAPARSPETVASIKMQCAYKAAATALATMTGQVADLETLKNWLDDIANHIVKNF